MSELVLKVITPAGSFGPYRCQSVRLNASDDAEGSGGGSCGIRPGHIESLISVEKGPLTAYSGGEVILSAECGNGFATVEDDVVTVVIEEYSVN